EQRAASWRESALEHCFESLRRHEHFLETSWHTLLPFKLLCAEVDTGIYGSRRLDDVLNPMLLNFVQRLRSLSRAECEASRVRRERERAEEDEEAPAPGQQAAEDDDGGFSCRAAASPEVTTWGRWRMVVGGYVEDMPVDALVERLWDGAERGALASPARA
ncbi:unnamed protein product, partial [Prorocentrum cordatum]